MSLPLSRVGLRSGAFRDLCGHPVIQSGADRAMARIFDGARNCRYVPIIVLLPGSRKSEVPRSFDLRAYGGNFKSSLRGRYVPLYRYLPDAGCRGHATAKWAEPPRIIVEMHDKFDAFAAAGVAMTKSGTPI